LKIDKSKIVDQSWSYSIDQQVVTEDYVIYLKPDHLQVLGHVDHYSIADETYTLESVASDPQILKRHQIPDDTLNDIIQALKPAIIP